MLRPPSPWPTAAGLLALAVAAGACETEQPEPGPAEQPPPVTADQPLGAEEQTVRAELDEWAVRLEADTIDAGPVTFTAVNVGEYDHILEVEGAAGEWETDEIPPGEQATLSVELEPGVYEVYCPIDDEHGEHEQLGMRTTLVVR